jgi:hypothetical protein
MNRTLENSTLLALSFDDLAKISGGAEKATSGSVEVSKDKVGGSFSQTTKSEKYDKCIDTVKDACKAANPGGMFSSNPKSGECTLSNMDKCKDF